MTFDPSGSTAVKADIILQGILLHRLWNTLEVSKHFLAVTLNAREDSTTQSASQVYIIFRKAGAENDRRKIEKCPFN